MGNLLTQVVSKLLGGGPVCESANCKFVLKKHSCHRAGRLVWRYLVFDSFFGLPRFDAKFCVNAPQACCMSADCCTMARELQAESGAHGRMGQDRYRVRFRSTFCILCSWCSRLDNIGLLEVMALKQTLSEFRADVCSRGEEGNGSAGLSCTRRPPAQPVQRRQMLHQHAASRRPHVAQTRPVPASQRGLRDVGAEFFGVRKEGS